MYPSVVLFVVVELKLFLSVLTTCRPQGYEMKDEEGVVLQIYKRHLAGRKAGKPVTYAQICPSLKKDISPARKKTPPAVLWDTTGPTCFSRDSRDSSRVGEPDALRSSVTLVSVVRSEGKLPSWKQTGRSRILCV